MLFWGVGVQISCPCPPFTSRNYPSRPPVGKMGDCEDFGQYWHRTGGGEYDFSLAFRLGITCTGQPMAKLIGKAIAQNRCPDAAGEPNQLRDVVNR